jgi:uncharacterized ion transporter superfamily protein YfcC
LTCLNTAVPGDANLNALQCGRALMRIWQELFGSTEGQFAIGVIGFMLVMGGWMAVMALKKSREKG